MAVNKYLSLLLICTLFISCSKKNGKITDTAQLKNKRICVLTGSAGDFAARKYFPDAVKMDLISASDAALTVKAGKAEAFIHNKTVLDIIVEKEPGLMILDKPVSQVEIAAAFKKGNTLVQSEISSALIKLRERGTLTEMKLKWVENIYKEVPPLPELNNRGQNGTLIMGTCAKAEPMSFQSNNIITGFDIELALRIGEILSKKIKIVDMPFESLIPALQSGKVDFALSNFNVTDERKKQLDFSEAYIVNDISVLVRK